MGVIKNLSLMGMGFYLRDARLLRVWLQFFWFVKLEPLISTPGTRFPRAVREPPRRFAPAGSPLDSHFPQESRTLRSNQLCFNSKIELHLLQIFLRVCKI
ncbi:hypothetical protein ASG97_02710 [Bacillus sp. Soil745]|nr:hypothetical protein ASG97_02710 [Bacillus sp. Soil745]